jgi:hypothetical protein
MAVKVMLAPAIAKGEVEPAKDRRQPGAQAKPRRRRSSVYDADGNEVFITLVCLKCHKMRPLSQFGLRKMADGAIRNQPWCRSCRSGAGADKPRKAMAAAASVQPAAAGPAPGPAPGPSLAAEASGRPQSASSVAAQVAAALAAGWSR